MPPSESRPPHLSTLEPGGDPDSPPENSSHSAHAKGRASESWRRARRKRRNERRRGGGGSGSTGDNRPNAIAYNNAYMEEIWGLFRHVGAMRLINRKSSAAGVELPSSPIDPKCKACPDYHIKGM